MKKIYLLLLTPFIFTACSYNADGLRPESYNLHPITFEVQYDFVCSGTGLTIPFSKGQRFLPKKLGGEKVSYKDGFYIKNRDTLLPEDTIGLMVKKVNGLTPLYLIINPDGHFSNDYPFLKHFNSGLTAAGYSPDPCNVKGRQAPFVRIDRKP